MQLPDNEVKLIGKSHFPKGLHMEALILFGELLKLGEKSIPDNLDSAYLKIFEEGNH